MVSCSVFVYARGVRRLDRPPTPEESYRRFVAMLREGRGLRDLRAFLPEDATDEDVLKLHRRLRGIGRQPSAAKGQR